MVILMPYSGKQFEEDFKKSALADQNVDIYRLYDTTGGFKGICNICDFILYQQPVMAYLELKAVSGKSLPFVNLTPTQWKGLLSKMKYPGVMPGILVNFYSYSMCYFVHISVLADIERSGKKSINMSECAERGIAVPIRKKRVRFDVDVASLMTSLIREVKHNELR